MLALVQMGHFLGAVSLFCGVEVISDITNSFRFFTVPSAPILEINSARSLLEAISSAAESLLFRLLSGSASNNAWIFSFI